MWHRLSWENVSRLCHLRRKYVQLYAVYLQQIPKKKAKGQEPINFKTPVIRGIKEKSIRRSWRSELSHLLLLSRGSRKDHLLTKVCGDKFEKVDRLMELYIRYADQVKAEIGRI